ncbi:MAG: hypothetical protein ACI8QC_004449, partial [Planctomycetota bacterium]
RAAKLFGPGADPTSAKYMGLAVRALSGWFQLSRS